MPFVKLDCGMLNSTLWFERTARELFITSLLMAEPFEATEPLPQLEINSLNPTGWHVPPGWYGFIPAAGVGIIRRAQLEVTEETKAALVTLGEPEAGSRSQDFDGRRLVRVDGGFIVLNFIKYRDRDPSAAERMKRWRRRNKLQSGDTSLRVTRDGEQKNRNGDTALPVSRDALKKKEKKGIQRKERKTEAEAEAEAEVKEEHTAFTTTSKETGAVTSNPQTRKSPTNGHADEHWSQFQMAYPAHRRSGGYMESQGFLEACARIGFESLLAKLEKQKHSLDWQDPKFIPSMKKYFEQTLWIRDTEEDIKPGIDIGLEHARELERQRKEKRR
jgi:hypothetical protein